ncbi:MAG: ATP-dependent DNA helicase RecQ [Cytophagales bacterium]|nr:ATP-dependent DNA helicase RecQ [Armatimonadota bacterium]
MTAPPSAPDTAAPDTLRRELKHLFGHDDFRSGQREIVEAAVAGVDTLAVLPTGGGKSLTYQLPAMLVPGATLVLSPLIALMKDQAENLPPEVAARSTIINSSLDPSEVGRRLAMVKAGRIKMVYAAPERLRQPTFLHALRRAEVSLVVVDEAHCISQWGHDFRPDYRAVGKAVEALGPRSVLAVTATATPEVQSDIEKQLGRTTKRIVRATYRDNLLLSCRKVQGEDDKLWATLEICRDTPGAGLVYAGSREKCEQLSRMLKRHGVAAGFYHAGLPPAERAAAQDRFMSGEVRVMAATVAFGMGVDKQDIRFLVHYHPSRTLENYYQEAGRAGRDGRPSFCTLLFSSADAASATRHLREDMLSLDHIKRVYGAVREAVGRNRIASVGWEQLFEAVGGDENLIRATLPLLEESGLIARHVDLPRSISIHPDFSAQGAEEGLQNADWDAFAPILRGGGEFDPRDLSEETGVPLPALEETLLRFQDAGYLTYRASPRQPLLELLPAPPDTRQRMEATLLHRAKGQDERLRSMQAYARDPRCRHGQIARYFGDRWPNRPCGMCDICVKTAPAAARAASDGFSPEKAPLAALQVVHDLAQGYRPFALGKSGLLKALRGTPDAPIKPDRTSAFGTLGDYKKSEVDRLIESLIEQGYLRRDEESEYRSLYLTGDGQNAVASGEADVEWRAAAPVPTPKMGRGGAATDLPDNVDAALLDTFKHWRRGVAQADNVPPYVVFADKVLIALAAGQPTNEFDLLEIPGIGPAKAAKYGDTVLEIVRKHHGR